MFKLKLNPSKNITYKKVNYANFQNGINTTFDEYSTPISYSKNAYNFDFKNGALKTGLGVTKLIINAFRDDEINPFYKEIATPDGVDVLAIWTFDRYVDDSTGYDTNIIIYCSDKNLYFTTFLSSLFRFSKIDTGDCVFNSIPTAIKYKIDGYDSIIFTTPEDGMYVYTPTTYRKYVKNCPPITSMCVHYERLFATVDKEQISLWFSDDLDPTNWNVSSVEAGFINMVDARGKLNKVLSFKDYVYVFREYGISKLTAYGNQEDFNVTHMFLSSTKIYENTVCVCGDVVLMMLKDGIYAFDGISVQKLNLNIENMLLANKNAVASYFNGKYYLACCLRFPDDENIGCENDNYTNNALIELDFEKGEFTITRGIDITYLYSSQDVAYSKLFCCYKLNGVSNVGVIENCGAVLDEPTPKFWRSPFTNFGYPNKTKILKEIYFNSKYEVEVIVETEKITKKFVVKPKHNKIKINANIIGNEFAIHFRSNSKEVYIANPVVIIGVYQ